MNPESQYTLHSTLRIIVIFFVPLFPALFAMTRLPKGKTEASGPFSGLRIKLTGGGAFYFILLLIAWALYPAPKFAEAAPAAGAWVVKGSVELAPETAGAEPPDALKVVTLQCKPTWQDTGNGGFVVTVAKHEFNGVGVWPSLTFTADKYKSVTIPTDDPKVVEINETKHTITIKDRIILNPLSVPAGGGKKVAAQEVPEPKSP